MAKWFLLLATSRRVLVPAFIVSVTGTALAADDKIVHGTTCTWRNDFSAPLTYEFDGARGSQLDVPPLPASWAYCPLVRDNSTAEITNIYVRVLETNAGIANKKISCKLCTGNGSQDLCTLPASAAANGLQSLPLDMASIDSYANEGYMVFCNVGPGSKIRSIKYTEP